MENSKEFIVCSAINYKGQIVTGISCREAINIILFFDKSPNEEEIKNNQGFITSTNRFVDRSEAYHIAKAADQIKYHIMNFKDEQVTKPFLMSINLYENLY